MKVGMMTEIMRQTLASQARSVSYCKRRKSAIGQGVTGVTDVTRDRMLWHDSGTLWAHSVWKVAAKADRDRPRESLTSVAGVWGKANDRKEKS